jgi:hypothetical protein
MNLALAEDLWKQQQKLRGMSPVANSNDAIERLLARLARQ